MKPLILALLLLTTVGCESQCYVKDFKGDITYRELFKERGTDSPIEDVWIYGGCLYVETEDGEMECIILPCGRR